MPHRQLVARSPPARLAVVSFSGFELTPPRLRLVPLDSLSAGFRTCTPPPCPPAPPRLALSRFQAYSPSPPQPALSLSLSRFRAWPTPRPLDPLSAGFEPTHPLAPSTRSQQVSSLYSPSPPRRPALSRCRAFNPSPPRLALSRYRAYPPSPPRLALSRFRAPTNRPRRPAALRRRHCRRLCRRRHPHRRQPRLHRCRRPRRDIAHHHHPQRRGLTLIPTQARSAQPTPTAYLCISLRTAPLHHRVSLPHPTGART